MNVIAMLMLATDLSGQPLPDVVLLDFGASYCQPCQQMVPVLQRMEKDRFPVRQIDITEQPQISRQYNVDRIPTLIVLVEGKEVKRFVGLTAETELRQAMNDAARDLDATRQAAGAAPAAALNQPAEDTPQTVGQLDPPRTGIRGIFDKMRRGFSGSEKNNAAESPVEQPDFRAQSPDEPPATSDAPMAATVRVRLIDGKMRDVGTGTVIHSTAERSIILTCAHIFQKVSDKAAVEVEVFQDGKTLKYPAIVLGGDHESDVALLKIQNTTPLPTVPLATQRPVLDKQEPLFSIGCSNGDLPTQLDMNVIEVNRYIGPENILCTNDPALGRSGGGLFDAQQRLVGVCSAADRKAQQGLYTGIKPILKLISQLKLDSVLTADPLKSNVPTAREDIAERTPDPFDHNSDDIFEEMFSDDASAEAFNESPATALLNQTAPTQSNEHLPDPFAVPSRSQLTAATLPQQNQAPAEITVIIDSPDPGQGKRVIVIPHPSPWLMELLTGERAAADDTGLANAREPMLSTTSTRNNAR